MDLNVLKYYTCTRVPPSDYVGVFITLLCLNALGDLSGAWMQSQEPTCDIGDRRSVGSRNEPPEKRIKDWMMIAAEMGQHMPQSISEAVRNQQLHQQRLWRQEQQHPSASDL
jgi:hypothetical protein